MTFEQRQITISSASPVLIVLPPFLGIDRPYLGLHTLQACARRAGFDVGVVYANVSFAAEIGKDLYNEICYAGPEELLGEQVFSVEAYGLDADRQRSHPEILEKYGVSFDNLRNHASNWTARFVDAVLAARPRIVGCNTTFEHTAASFSILGRLSRLDPGIITLLGGAN